MKRGIDCRGRQTTEEKGMAIIRCPNGHNYDSTLYRKCPICETEAAYNLSAAYDKTFKLKDVEDEPTRKLCGADDEKTIFN